jgi:hypothetical protein
MMWSQNRKMIFRAKNSCLQSYEMWATSMFSTDSQMMPKWIAPTLWQIYLVHSNKRSFLEEGRRMKNDLCFISTIAQFAQIGLQEVNSKSMTCAACHSHPIHLI